MESSTTAAVSGSLTTSFDRFMPERIPSTYTAPDNSEPKVFALIHGAWHSPEHWSYLKNALEELGHIAICPDLPSADPGATYDDDTDAVIEAIDPYENIFLVSHSRGIEVIPRILQKQERTRFVGAAILNSGGPRDISLKESTELPRYTEEFIEGIVDVGSGLTEFDRLKAIQVFYNGIKNHSKLRFALDKLRPQRLPCESEGPTPDLPDNLQPLWLLGNNDQVHCRERAMRVAKEWGHAYLLEINSDHSPQISKPKTLSQLLVGYSSIRINNL